MSEAKYYEMLKHELIPKILKVIEEHGVDMMHAEHIPMFLDKAIKNSNFRHQSEMMFKAFPWED